MGQSGKIILSFNEIEGLSLSLHKIRHNVVSLVDEEKKLIYRDERHQAFSFSSVAPTRPISKIISPLEEKRL